MRQADLAVCKRMAGPIWGADGITHLVKIVCEYCWDHVCGEPEETSPEAFFEHMKPILELWYSTATPQERSKTS